VGGIRRVCGQFGRDWEAGLRRLPFFTQRTAVLLLGVLVATRERRLGIDVAFARPAASAGPPHARRACPTGVLALLGGVVALAGWPGANGPTHLVPGEQAGRAPVSRPGPGDAAAPGARTPEAGDRSGADAGGAAAASPAPADTAPPGTDEAATREQEPGSAAAGGPSPAPPTTSPPTTTPPGPLDPVDDLLGPMVSTLVP
jgi:hypothetical protein